MAKPKDPVLIHPLRAEILRALEEEPGATLAELLRRVRTTTGNGNLARNPIAWHLNVLRRAGFLVSAKNGFHRRFYPARGPWLSDLQGCAFVQVPNRLLIARVVLHRPGLTVGEILARLPKPVKHEQVRYVLRGLVGQALIVQTRERGRMVNAPTTRLRRILAALSQCLPAFRWNPPPPPGRKQPDESPRPGLPPPGRGSPRSPFLVMR